MDVELRTGMDSVANVSVSGSEQDAKGLQVRGKTSGILGMAIFD